ncbi:hypothetical protein PGRAN_00480 [Listeria grandensis FSL F6-0971]|uniref:DUF422 domain-containing protein n=1 Tax=Listeria grandensis FSL F6-0971 TaxID=1265819 RepID=W7BK25_9LIST|nr:hypothetical protein [Listeria grandensis]EUJ25165.1 hypothetical protein PGRAN_00480 [Listeria grandensis FSL F6-0971]
MVEKRFRFFVWLYMAMFFIAVLLIVLNILPVRLTAVHALFFIVSGIFAVIFLILQYGKGLGSAITILIFMVSTCIEWMQTSLTSGGDGSGVTTDFGLVINGIPVAFGFIWLVLIVGTHVIAREITLKIKIDWLRGGIYAVIGATMVMVFEMLIEPVAMQVKQLATESPTITIIQMTDAANWWMLGLILHLMIYFMLSLTDQWGKLHFPTLKSELVLVYWIVLSFFLVLGYYMGLWNIIAITLTGNILFTICYYLSLENDTKKKPVA